MADQHSVLFFVQLAELTHRDRIVEVLRSVSGVADVSFPTSADVAPTIQGEIRVSYDPDQTNAVVLERALAEHGFAVLSAREETPR